MILAGIDLSLTASAIVVCDTGWDQRWGEIGTYVFGESLPRDASDDEHARRIARIADRLLSFLRGPTGGASVQCWIESYALGLQGKNKDAHRLIELGGVVRHELRGLGYELRTANMSSARKLLLGKVPKGKGVAKKTCQATLRSAGMPHSWTLDQSDAMVCLNYGMSEHAGATCFCAGQVRGG